MINWNWIVVELWNQNKTKEIWLIINMLCSTLPAATRYRLCIMHTQWKKNILFIFISVFQVSHFIRNLYMRIHCWETIPNSLAKQYTKPQKKHTQKCDRFTLFMNCFHSRCSNDYPYIVHVWWESVLFFMSGTCQKRGLRVQIIKMNVLSFVWIRDSLGYHLKTWMKKKKPKKK